MSEHTDINASDYESWIEQGRPNCPECDRNVMLGYDHWCPELKDLVKIPVPRKFRVL